MTRHHATVGVLLAVFAYASLGAQARPDFSGRWTSDPEPVAAAGGQPGARGGARSGARGGGVRGGDMGSGWGSPITITQNAARLTVEYAFFARGDMQPPLRFVYALDGTPTTNTVAMGHGTQEQRSRTAWDDNTLVIVTVHPFTNPDTGEAASSRVVRRLTLESPATLVVEVTREGVLGGSASTTRTMYRKID